jgi:hypothetical protein
VAAYRGVARAGELLGGDLPRQLTTLAEMGLRVGGQDREDRDHGYGSTLH